LHINSGDPIVPDVKVTAEPELKTSLNFNTFSNLNTDLPTAEYGI
jgi:hypothetical protein